MQLIYWKSSFLLEMLNFAIDFLPYILKELIHDLGMFFPVLWLCRDQR